MRAGAPEGAAVGVATMHHRVRLAVVGALTSVALVACTGGDPEPGPVTTASSASSQATSTQGAGTDEVTQEQLEAFLAVPDDVPLASGTGTLRASASEAEKVSIDVLELDARADATYVRWRMTPESGQLAVSGVVWVDGSLQPLPPLVSLVDAKADSRLFPLTWDAEADAHRGGCACADLPPKTDATGTELSALYPPLSHGTASVKLAIAGVATLTVPVTWS